MKVELWWIGKTSEKYLKAGIEEYHKRTRSFVPVKLVEIPLPKKGSKLTTAQQKQKEGEAVLSRLSDQDHLILLDEKGKTFSSVQFADFLENQMRARASKLIFLIGGAYGFDQPLYDRSNDLLSLSKMTFSHQLIRLIVMEQLYRAMTIQNGHPYHNE